MHYRKLGQSNYIAAVEFEGKEPTVTITSAVLVSMEDRTGKPLTKGVITMKETPRGWVLNRTNRECLKEMFGEETDRWVGKRVTLYAEDVKVDGQLEKGIRVKGSPDIDRTISFMLKLPRKGPRRVTLVPTKKGAVQAPVQDREPGSDDDQGPPPGPDGEQG